MEKYLTFSRFLCIHNISLLCNNKKKESKGKEQKARERGVGHFLFFSVSGVLLNKNLFKKFLLLFTEKKVK